MLAQINRSFSPLFLSSPPPPPPRPCAGVVSAGSCQECWTAVEASLSHLSDSLVVIAIPAAARCQPTFARLYFCMAPLARSRPCASASSMSLSPGCCVLVSCLVSSHRASWCRRRARPPDLCRWLTRRPTTDRRDATRGGRSKKERRETHDETRQRRSAQSRPVKARVRRCRARPARCLSAAVARSEAHDVSAHAERTHPSDTRGEVLARVSTRRLSPRPCRPSVPSVCRWLVADRRRRIALLTCSPVPSRASATLALATRAHQLTDAETSIDEHRSTSPPLDMAPSRKKHSVNGDGDSPAGLRSSAVTSAGRSSSAAGSSDYRASAGLEFEPLESLTAPSGGYLDALRQLKEFRRGVQEELERIAASTSSAKRQYRGRAADQSVDAANRINEGLKKSTGDTCPMDMASVKRFVSTVARPTMDPRRRTMRQ